MLALIMSVSAQNYDRELLITFEQFKEKVSSVNIPGFSGKPQFDDELDDEYQAAFIQGSDVFMITIEARHNPPVWMGSPYDLEGKSAEFVVMGNLGMLMIDLPEVFSTLTLASTKIKEKSTLERIARDTGLMDIKPASIAWPSSIPVDYRLSGTLLEAFDSSGSDADGFSREVRVTLIMSNELKLSLTEMAARFVDEGNFLRFPNGIILNYPFSDIEDLDDMYSDYDEIRFLYYVP